MGRRTAFLCWLFCCLAFNNRVRGIEPLSVSSNQRYLVDSQGRPVFLQGDAAWSLVTAVNLNDAQTYLEDRAERSFDAIIVSLIEHFYNGPTTVDGEYPFANSSNPDFTQLNDAYFDHAEAVIAAAEERGIYVLLALPTWDTPTLPTAGMTMSLRTA